MNIFVYIILGENEIIMEEMKRMPKTNGKCAYRNWNAVNKN